MTKHSDHHEDDFEIGFGEAAEHLGGMQIVIHALEQRKSFFESGDTLQHRVLRIGEFHLERASRQSREAGR